MRISTPGAGLRLFIVALYALTLASLGVAPSHPQAHEAFFSGRAGLTATTAAAAQNCSARGDAPAAPAEQCCLDCIFTGQALTPATPVDVVGYRRLDEIVFRLAPSPARDLSLSSAELRSRAPPARG